MTRHKLDVQKRQHRERSQPLNRQKFGLLEKHSDYIQRAKDYNSKKDRIKKLKLKASLKNQDEFYFKMINSKTIDGLHFNFNKSNLALDNQLVKLLKTQDFNYVKTCRAIEEKKIVKLKERLGSMVTQLNCEEASTQKELNREILDLINQSVSATGAKNLDSSCQAGLKSSQEESLKIGKKIVFVDSIEEVKNFDPSSLRKTKKKNKNKLPDNTSPSNDKTSSKSRISAEELSEQADELRNNQEAHTKKLVTELRSRLGRLRVLQTAERELELKKSLMGKGSKFLKFGSSDKKPKLKGLINGRDLSWYDKLDRNQLIEEDREREQAEKLNAGIKTGAKVWKWKQERKK